MIKVQLEILPATDSDMPVIEQVAKKFDLDCEHMSGSQFIVVKREKNIIGIGRLRDYPEQTGWSEIATVAVIEEERKRGVGSMIVRKLIDKAPSEIFVTCVIPDFFTRFGFQKVKQYPSVLEKKVDFCKSFNFQNDQIFIMCLKK